MEQENFDRLTLKDEMINAFRPIEQLFKIMESSTLEIDGTIIRCYAEIGLELTGNFRRRMEQLLCSNQEGGGNDAR